MVHGKQLAWSLESNEYSKMVASLSASFKKLRRLTEVKFFSPSHIVIGRAITPTAAQGCLLQDQGTTTGKSDLMNV